MLFKLFQQKRTTSNEQRPTKNEPIPTILLRILLQKTGIIAQNSYAISYSQFILNAIIKNTLIILKTDNCQLIYKVWTILFVLKTEKSNSPYKHTVPNLIRT
jgi:hypothetical protein